MVKSRFIPQDKGRIEAVLLGDQNKNLLHLAWWAMDGQQKIAVLHGAVGKVVEHAAQ